jgi:hypothetical protein
VREEARNWIVPGCGEEDCKVRKLGVAGDDEDDVADHSHGEASEVEHETCSKCQSELPKS